MGEVFAAENARTGRHVAVKLLRADSKTKSSAVERFRREARAAGSINSDHVTQVLDVEEDAEHGIVLVFELLEGESLIDRLKRTGPVPFDELFGIIEQTWMGLADAHRVGIIHRDLKPSNVFLERRPDGQMRVKILDFGISKLPKEMGGETLTEMGQSLGTFSFMPPEQIGKAKTVDHRADIYACATLIYQALSGQLPYSARNILVMVELKSKTDPRSLSEVMDRAADPRLEAFLKRGLARDPGERFQSAVEALNAWRDLRPQQLGGPASSAQVGQQAPMSSVASGHGGGHVQSVPPGQQGGGHVQSVPPGHAGGHVQSVGPGHAGGHAQSVGPMSQTPRSASTPHSVPPHSAQPHSAQPHSAQPAVSPRQGSYAPTPAMAQAPQQGHPVKGTGGNEAFRPRGGTIAMETTFDTTAPTKPMPAQRQPQPQDSQLRPVSSSVLPPREGSWNPLPDPSRSSVMANASNAPYSDPRGAHAQQQQYAGAGSYPPPPSHNPSAYNAQAQAYAQQQQQQQAIAQAQSNNIYNEDSKLPPPSQAQTRVYNPAANSPIPGYPAAPSQPMSPRPSVATPSSGPGVPSAPPVALSSMVPVAPTSGRSGSLRIVLWILAFAALGAGIVFALSHFKILI